MKERVCELCKAEASLYCEPDSAYLCFGCDSRVHGANFLVARHVRRAICRSCASLGRRISGPGHRPFSPICRSCSAASSSSSSCISSAESASTAKGGRGSARPRRWRDGDARAEGVLVGWCARLGVERRRHVADARRAMAAALPFRVRLAAALWFAMSARGTGDARRLAGLESCSGVPGRVIARLARVLGRRAREGEEEEGWAECT
ncbi:hypothetical protein QJS10_CPA05g02409 [Acorus calamus]|uniref:B box-type domain-containing protein n=1 Tax=Acorus calamus TaxID=4465 RepID=A0AAV9ERP8_ACOCL|nr:hypothetical protein QJS10_CPA05g02409 [Acorus calamus]